MANAVAKTLSSQPGSTMISVRIDTFRGLNLYNTEQSLDLGETIIASNIDFSRNNKPRRRKGYANLISGNWHSLFSDTITSLGVFNGDLTSINSDWTTSLILAGMGPSVVHYVSINGNIYLTNNQIVGSVQNGQWVPFGSPVGMLKMPPMPGSLIEYFNARLYIVQGRTIFISDPVRFTDFDYKNGFKQLPLPVIMLRAVDGGMFVSDTANTYFMEGQTPEKFKLWKIFNSPAIPGTDVIIDASLIKEGIKGRALMWLSREGICYGLSDGSADNKTERNYPIPANISGGSGIVIREPGETRYVVAVW